MSIRLTSITGKLALVISGCGILMWMIAGAFQIIGIADGVAESLFCIGTYLIPFCVVGFILGGITLFFRPDWPACTAIVLGALGTIWLIGSITELRTAGSGHIARELNRWGSAVQPQAIELLDDDERTEKT